MSRSRQLFYRSTLFVAIFLLFVAESRATHMYGADLFYTHISGNKYKVSLYIYGDCSGSAFPNLPGAPVVRVLNGNTLFKTLTLSVENPTNGLEVTPVCPAQKNNTKCTSLSNTIPGVKRFTYSDTVTLNTTSTNWRFRFTGAMGNTSAGRSNGITNIFAGTTMNLEATLNNTSVTNASPTYTTIPTPFFCINKFVNYNNGAIDANGDSLVYSLVSGLTSGGTVTYNTGYSATSPLAVATGSFSFNTATGQLAFLPNLLQKSLVVIKVSEYRNGVLVGTSMREMTFIIANCINNPPKGLMSNNNIGTIDSTGTKISVCKPADTLKFSINPTDLDTTDSITMSYTGLPAGASVVVGSNNTKTPTSLFTWKISNVPPGMYVFFITYLDNGCPLVSKQTMAYTIEILPEPKATVNILSEATCTKKAAIKITPITSPSPWQLKVLQGTTVVHSFNNVTTSQIDSLLPGTYTIRAINVDSCSWDTSIVLSTPPQVGVSVVVDNIKCYGDSTGKVTVTGSGGKTPFTYAINTSSYSSTNIFNNLPTGTYTFKVKDTNECVKDTTLSLTQPNKIIPQAGVKNATCLGMSNGSVLLSATGGTTPYTYALGSNAFSSNTTFTALATGTYTFYIKDTNSCVADTSISIVDSLLLSANYIIANALCADSNSGVITVNPSGGATPYTFAINSGAYTSANSFTALGAGTYTIKIKDSFGCKKDSSIVVNEPQPLSISTNITTPLCYADSNGTVSVTAAGGTTPYQYAIDNSAFNNSNIFTAIKSGTYIIKVKDTNGCYKDTSVEVKDPIQIKQAITITDVKCFGEATGIVTVNGNGGVTPYTYAINTGSFINNGSFTNLTASTYTIKTKDANGCIKDSVISVKQPTKIIPIISTKQSTCEELSDGKIELKASGGTPTYLYAIGTNAYSSNGVFTPLASGTYTVHVKDTNNCIVDTAISISDSLQVTAKYVVNDALCADSSSGSIIVTPNGGTSPYQYSVNAGAYNNANAINNLAAGNYSISIKDNYGCKKDTNLAVAEPSKVNLYVSITEPNCNTSVDGIIGISGSGGTTPYQYAINANAFSSSNVYSGLGAGTFTIKIKDSNNCYRDSTVELKAPDAIKLELNITDVKCYGDSSGKVSFNTTGGTPAYTYGIDGLPFQSSATLSNIRAGNHVVKVRDSKGCYKDTNIGIQQPDKLFISQIDLKSSTCEGFADGSVSFLGKGGTPPYLYSIDNKAFDNSNTKKGLREGSHNITVKDGNDCIVDSGILLQGLPHTVLDDADITPVTCFGFSDGAIQLTATGGTPPFKYQLDNGNYRNSAVFRDLDAGEYKVTVTDSLGCKKDTSLWVPSPNKMRITTLVTPNNCDGQDNSGMITAEVSGGTQPYNYYWNTDTTQNKNSIVGIPNGKYLVVVSDINGCTDSMESVIKYDNCCTIFIPDAFTPNNDGLNDYARILHKGEFKLKNFSMYNRFGERVFTTDDINAGWNGIHNGELQDLGTYFYFVKGICGDTRKSDVMYKGTITLIR